MKEITNPISGISYLVSRQVWDNSDSRAYLCNTAGGKEALMKIAAEVAGNGKLDREVYILRTMNEQARDIQEQHERSGGKGKLNYHFFFPRVSDAFVCEDQEGRQVSILTFDDIIEEGLGELVPIGRIATHDKERIDPRTSAWIIGKLLKFLGFTHGQGFTSTINEDNILLNRKEHFVALFDWTESEIDVVVPEFRAAEEISLVAQHVITALGGNLETGALPENEQLIDGRYEGFLWNLASGNESDANKAHTEFYTLIDELWPKGFHPYTAYPLQ
jgi:hypothetical protein